jgi:NAD(P)-dependent dehydrogenase (short-subunit alcohol dehydrogenase family)
MGRAITERLRADGLQAVTLDVSSPADLIVDVTDSALVTTSVAEIGHVDVLVNCAGVIGPRKPLAEVTDEEWDNLFAVHAFGTFAMCRAVVPGMVERGWGRVVNIASLSGKNGTPWFGAYSAAKGAVIALTKAWGQELGPTGVLMNAIAPGFIRTPMNDGSTPEDLASIVSNIPLGRAGTPHEVANLVSWLVSDEATFSTGAVFDISGGRASY